MATPGGSACALRPWTKRSEGSGSSDALRKASTSAAQIPTHYRPSLYRPSPLFHKKSNLLDGRLLFIVIIILNRIVIHILFRLKTVIAQREQVENMSRDHLQQRIPRNPENHTRDAEQRARRQ